MLKYNFASSPRHHFCLLLFVCASAVLMADRKVMANENNQEQEKPSPVKRKSSSTYCGVHCLYTVMKLENNEVEFHELLKPEYIGSRIGSSFKELKKAAEDYGMHSLPVNNLASRESGTHPRQTSSLSPCSCSPSCSDRGQFSLIVSIFSNNTQGISSRQLVFS